MKKPSMNEQLHSLISNYIPSMNEQRQRWQLQCNSTEKKTQKKGSVERCKKLERGCEDSELQGSNERESEGVGERKE